MLEENLLFQESVCLFVWQFYLWFPQDCASTLCCNLIVMFSQMPLVLAAWTSILEMTEPNKMDRTFICNLLLYLQKITSLFKHPRVLSSVSTLWNVLPLSFQTSCCSKSPLNIFLLYKIVANYFNSLQFPLLWMLWLLFLPLFLEITQILSYVLFLTTLFMHHSFLSPQGDHIYWRQQQSYYYFACLIDFTEILAITSAPFRFSKLNWI